MPAELEKPPGSPATPTGDEPVIHVIPEKFHGAALKLKAKTPPPPPQAPPPTPIAPMAAMPPALPPGQTPKALPPKPKGKKGLIFAVLAIVLLLAAGGGAFFFLKGSGQPPVNTNVPVGPVCGDSKCDATETPFSCQSDCGPVPPVCGDGKCDVSESTDSCASDCGASAPVCGDQKCEAPEDAESCSSDCGPPPPPPPPKGGTDTDSDGLTDLEETSIYGTNVTDVNTDHDAFVDVNEVINLFDPSKPTPAGLAENTGILVYTNVPYNYEVYSPASWSRRTTDSTEKETFFTASTGEFVEVLVEENPDNKKLLDWYLEQDPNVKSSEVAMFKTRQGYDEILSPDGLTAYIAVGSRIYVVAYNLGTSAEIQFKSTFAMMINSLKVK